MDGDAHRKACTIGLGRRSSLRLRCLVQSEIERAHLPHNSALSSQATPRRLGYSRMLDLSGDELG